MERAVQGLHPIRPPDFCLGGVTGRRTRCGPCRLSHHPRSRERLPAVPPIPGAIGGTAGHPACRRAIGRALQTPNPATAPILRPA